MAGVTPCSIIFHSANRLVEPLRLALKPCMLFQMLTYKRNQVEEAISAVLEPRSKSPSTEMRTRIKRLLETDRASGRVPRSSDPERAHYAFYSDDAPGSGVEVRFSDYEVFALLNGLRLLDHGWPQGFVVSVIRRVRSELEKEHARILKLDAKKIFNLDEIGRHAQEGAMAFEVTDPVLLTIVTKSGPPSEVSEPSSWKICEGPQAAMNFLGQAGRGIGAGTMFELVSVAHRLTDALAHTEPQRRGRG
jgi:hypothetical protein